MSETVHYKGVLPEVEKYDFETLEDQCKRLLKYKELPSFCNTYAEHLEDIYYQEFIVINNTLYRVEKDEVDPEYSIFRANKNEYGEIEFEVRYYNGGCSFNEAISGAIKGVK